MILAVPKLSPEEVSLIFSLVAIESFSGHEREAATYLSSFLSARGWQAEIDEAGNTVAAIGSGPATLLFLGHIDTAPGSVPVHIDGDLLYGRGTVDAKGSLAAFVSAVERVKAQLKCRIIFIAAVGEETPYSPGAHYVVDRYRPDFCIIGEPSGWAAVTLGYKGSLGLTVSARQPVGHSAGPDDSAPEKTAAYWQQVQSFCDSYNIGNSGFARLDPTLQNASNTGDNWWQESQFHLSFRLPTGLEPEGLKAKLESLASPGLNLNFTPGLPAFKGEKNTPLTRAFLAAIRSLGGRPSFKLKSGTADMNIVGPAWNVPILAYGPGDSSLDHTPFEHLSLWEHAQAIAVLTQVLLHMLPGGSNLNKQ